MLKREKARGASASGAVGLMAANTSCDFRDPRLLLMKGRAGAPTTYRGSVEGSVLFQGHNGHIILKRRKYTPGIIILLPSHSVLFFLPVLTTPSLTLCSIFIDVKFIEQTMNLLKHMTQWHLMHCNVVQPSPLSSFKTFASPQNIPEGVERSLQLPLPMQATAATADLLSRQIFLSEHLV